ncbi:hypothetical protein ACJMK2_003466 [Sinanodonta woodiana]|uniref:Uncharacterized protein n=1 Tax=Sinanodonta woodiana TaxID=1069815 RepID=A0ABD3Y1X4_SINWO
MAAGDLPRLYEVTGNVLCADGKPLEVVEKGEFTLSFGINVKSTALSLQISV